MVAATYNTASSSLISPCFKFRSAAKKDVVITSDVSWGGGSDGGGVVPTRFLLLVLYTWNPVVALVLHSLS